MSLAQEFKAFVARGNVIDLAVAVVLGGAFGKIVTATVEGVVMPLIGALLPGGDWRTFTVTPLNLKLGAVLGSAVDFVVISAVVFLVINKAMAQLKAAPPPAAPTTKTCAECLEAIPLAAKRCKACAQPVVPA